MYVFPLTYLDALVPGGGVPGRGFELDQPPDSLCTPPHTGHNSDPRRRELTLHQVLPVWHVCVMQGPQRPPNDNGLMLTGRIEEADSPGGGGGKGGGWDGIHIRWNVPCPSNLFQIFWVNSHGGGRQLARGGQQPAEGKAEADAADKGAG